MAGKLGAALTAIGRRRLPTHLTAPVRLMIEAMAGGLSAPLQAALRPVLIPSATDPVLRLAGSQDEDLDPLLRNTATATLVRTGGGLKRAPRRRSTSTDAWYPGTSPPSCSTNSRPFPDDTDLETV